MTDEKRLTKYYKEVERFMEAYELAFITNQPLPKRPSYKKKPLFTNLTPVLTKAESCLLEGHRLEARESIMADFDGSVVVCLDCRRIIGIETNTGNKSG